MVLKMETEEKKKKWTIDYIKDQIEVSDELQKKLKKYNEIKRTILKAIKSEPKTIPQIAKETNIAQDVITYHVMTLRKYHDIEVGDLDDMDEYYFYKKKGK
jgi:predicted transcriptional regulator